MTSDRSRSGVSSAVNSSTAPFSDSASLSLPSSPSARLSMEGGWGCDLLGARARGEGGLARPLTPLMRGTSSLSVEAVSCCSFTASSSMFSSAAPSN